MTEKTHYRKAFDSPYLSSADIVEPTVLTVKCVTLEPDHTKKTKDEFNTAYFMEREIRPGEKLKPMILNATNSKTMKGLTGSAFIDDWQNVRVTVYVDPNVRFAKETVEGLRISAHAPPSVPPELLTAAREASMGGWKAFSTWIKTRSEADRALLDPESDKLKAAAREADARGK